MPSSQVDALAERLTKASLQDRLPDTAINQLEENVAERALPSQASLLGIPQELRNKIFEYVYGVSDNTGVCVDMVFHEPQLSSEWLYDEGLEVPYVAPLQAMIPPLVAPPSRSPTSVCRQLYTEMKNMQAAAIRQYWGTNTFSAKWPINDQLLLHDYHAAEQKDLMHAKHFIVHPECLGQKIPVDIRFEAGQWNASSNVSEEELGEVVRKSPAGMVRSRYGFLVTPQRPLRSYLRGLENFYVELFPRLIYNRSHDELYNEYGERKALDPNSGHGLTANDLTTAHRVAGGLVVRPF